MNRWHSFFAWMWMAAAVNAVDELPWGTGSGWGYLYLLGIAAALMLFGDNLADARERERVPA